MRLLRTYGLVALATAVAALSFWFRPGGVTGPRPDAIAAAGKGFDHAGLGEALRGALRPDGSVDYAGLRREPAALDRYLGQLRATSPANAPHRFKTDEDRLAYYLNAYNAFVLAAVRDRCPITDVDSVYLAGGFFWRVSFLIGEEPVTLSDLESRLIREVARGEPAVHFALVKGARGFPAPAAEPYEGATVRAQLEALGQRVARDPRFVRREGDTLRLSKLFEWYQADFAGDPAAWLRARAPEVVPEKPTVTYEPGFDWSLNGGC